MDKNCVGKFGSKKECFTCHIVGKCVADRKEKTDDEWQGKVKKNNK